MKVVFTILGALCALSGLSVAAEKPNVLIILADDLGYGDVRCYNPRRGKIATPHLDQLASQGMRFTDAHTSSGVCSPTRYALLTGRYHWRTRLQQGIVQYLEKPLIAPGRLTLASLCKQHGYRTAAIGKWHLGWDFQLTEDERKLLKSYGGKVTTEATDADRATWRTIYSREFRGGPVAVGFDSYFGTDVPNWPPYCFIEGERTVGIPGELLPAGALRKNQASLQGPALAGWKLEAVLPTLTDRACSFIEDAAKKPEPFFLYLPLTAPHTPIAVAEEWRGKSGLNDYADFVMQTDATVGRVLDALERSGAAEKTLVIFTSDNGCAPYAGAKELEAKGHFPSGPLRGYKADAWEGGHRVPFIVRWPGVVKPDTRCDALVQQTDIMATLAETFGSKLPDTAGEDSMSLMPLLKGGTQPVREHAISHASSGLPALRKGSWKIIFGQKGGGFAGAPGVAETGQIYDLAADLGETKNLWSEKPEIVAELTATMERLVTEGRSTPGAKQPNDVPVRWRRFLRAETAPKPLKVFVLAGQSNMEGQAVVDLTGKDYNEGKGTLAELLRDPAKGAMFSHLRGADGKWTVRDDVWVRYQREERPLLKGPLGIGYAVYGGTHHFGAELQFGHVIGERLENPVLLIKTAWGGKSLFKDFRPPSSGGETGPYYKKMLSEVRTALTNLEKEFPACAGRGCELAGFVWWHGWNDGVDPKTAVPEYEQNLVNLINDLRREFAAPKLPVVIGELTGPWVEAPPEWEQLRKAQAAVAARPEFAGTVAFVSTRNFVRKPEDSPNPTHGHHEFGNAETYFLVGDALGRGMVSLLEKQTAAAPQKKLPLDGEVFMVQGHTAFLIPGKVMPDAKTKPWVWYAPTLPGLPGPEERWMFEQFQAAGISVAGIDAGESYGSPDGRALYSALYDELTGRRGYSRKPVMLGRSRGGLMTLCWAAENADKVGGFAGIYPVCNMASYPGIEKAAPAYRLKPDELTAKLAGHNPVDRLATLAKAKVPLFAIHGDVDQVVPLEANSGLLKSRYEALGGSMQLIVPKGQGHNMWTGFFQCAELVTFVKANAK